MRSCRAYMFFTFTDRSLISKDTPEISRFPLMKFMHMPQVSDSGKSNKHSHYRACSCCLPHRPTRSALPKGDFGAQYCAYASPANASPRHHWSSRHSSGPEWIATPFSVMDLTLLLIKSHLLSHAGFNRRFQDVPFYLLDVR